jgi:hypothetical protein
MHLHARLSLCLAIGLSQLPAFAAGPDAVLPPHAKVAGQSQSTWSERWWQWAYSFDRTRSPMTDQTGSLCGASQSGDVWFLAGSFDTRPVRRKCTVPQGKYIFFPLINFVVYPSQQVSLSCELATRTAERKMDDISTLVVEVDGAAVPGLERHRQASSSACFDAAARVGGGLSPSAANGYYVMLKPLAAGQHTLRFGAELPSFRQEVVYELTVK